MKSVIVGGVVGGVVLFIWGAVAHMATPIGEMGVRQVREDAAMDAVMEPMGTHLSETGFYFVPGMKDIEGKSDEEATAIMEEWAQKYEAGPTAIVVYNKTGEAPMSAKHFAVQFTTNLATALIASALLSAAVTALPKYVHRFAFVASLGLFAWIAISVPYWNWFRFPLDFTLGGFLDSTIGWVLAGLAIAAVVKPPAAGGGGATAA